MIVLLEYNNDTIYQMCKEFEAKKFIKFLENLTVANYIILYEKIDLCTKQLEL